MSDDLFDAGLEIMRLRAALKVCADDLEEFVEAHYEKTKGYPSEMRRYERDIAPVKAARELLGHV